MVPAEVVVETPTKTLYQVTHSLTVKCNIVPSLNISSINRQKYLVILACRARHVILSLRTASKP